MATGNYNVDDYYNYSRKSFLVCKFVKKLKGLKLSNTAMPVIPQITLENMTYNS